MKRGILLTFLFCLLWAFTGRAVSVIINVDNANNVTVQTNSGYGTTLDLVDGMNQFDLDDTTDSPLLIKAKEGAAIVSVTKNEANTINPSGDGNYRVTFTSACKIDIVTSGEGQGGETVKNVTLSFTARGENVTGKPFTVTYEKDGEWVAPEAASWGGYLMIPERAKVKITPDKVYKIDSCETPGYTGAFDGALQGDGSYVFTNTLGDYFGVIINMSLKDTAILFSITVDYTPNVDCYLENERQGTNELLTLYDGVKTSFAIDASQNPLEFIPTSGAEIVQILKNGEVQSPIGWNGAGGWVFEVENGDNFVVTTKGAPTDILVEAPEGNADLKYYYFTKPDGSQIDLSGMSALLKGNLGETIKVSPRPGTTMTYIMASNGGKSDWMTTMQVVKGANGTDPAKYQIFGTHPVNGVVIDVDAASRVKVLQEGGRGDELQLTDGKNEFALDDIKNALAFSSTEGNQLVSVTVNGNNVNVNPNGYYMVEAVEGDWINVVSRKNPVDATLTFTFNEGMGLNALNAVSEGNVVTLTNPMTVKSYTTLTLSAADGYVLNNVSCETAGVNVEKLAEGNGYNVTVASADVTAATIAVELSEMQASEGNSIVIPNGDELMVVFWEMTEKDGPMSETFVKKLNNNSVNEVKTGNWIRIYCKDTQSEFGYIKVNGETIELEKTGEDLVRVAWVQVEGRTVIDTKIVTPCQVMTNPSYDDVKHIESGNVYIEIDGQQYTSVMLTAGQTIKLVAAPARGYVFDHFEKFYSLTVEGIALEGDTYTITEEDARENFILFKGVFNEDPNEKVFALRGSSAWLLDENRQPLSAVGTVMFQLNDGSLSRETTGIAGEKVNLFVTVTNQEDANKYEVEAYSLMNGFPNAVIPQDYEISAADADSEGVIWICAIIREKSSGVEGVSAGNLAYDSKTMTLRSNGAVKVFNIEGQLVKESSEAKVSVAELEQGVYIAVSGNDTIKFVK